MKDKDLLLLGLVGVGAYLYFQNQIKQTQKIVTNPFNIINQLIGGIKLW